MSHTNESVLMCTMCSCASAVWLCLQMPINMLEYAVYVPREANQTTDLCKL